MTQPSMATTDTKAAAQEAKAAPQDSSRGREVVALGHELETRLRQEDRQEGEMQKISAMIEKLPPEAQGLFNDKLTELSADRQQNQAQIALIKAQILAYLAEEERLAAQKKADGEAAENKQESGMVKSAAVAAVRAGAVVAGAAVAGAALRTMMPAIRSRRPGEMPPRGAYAALQSATPQPQPSALAQRSVEPKTGLVLAEPHADGRTVPAQAFRPRSLREMSLLAAFLTSEGDEAPHPVFEPALVVPQAAPQPA